MKKKKFLATIASLALAVSLLAFGVYSAMAVTFNVNSTVTYTFSDVLVDVKASLFSIDTGTTSIINAGTLESFTDENWTEVSGGVTNGTLKSYTGSDGVYTQDDDASTVNSSIAFNMNNAFAYKVEIEFTTVSAAGVTVSYNSTTFTDTEGDNIALIIEADAANSSIVVDETYTFTYYVLLEDATREVNLSLPSLSFTVNKTA